MDNPETLIGLLSAVVMGILGLLVWLVKGVFNKVTDFMEQMLVLVKDIGQIIAMNHQQIMNKLDHMEEHHSKHEQVADKTHDIVKSKSSCSLSAVDAEDIKRAIRKQREAS